MRFISLMLRNQMWTSTVAKVIAVNTTAKTVDIQPCVNQIDGSGSPWPHGTIYGAPYIYFQGGINAVVIDPAVGDIGLALFASHDISSVIANSAPANPGSKRRFDPADAMYIGAFPGLSPSPTQTVVFGESGITINAPGQTVTINAQAVQINCDVTVDGKLTATTDVVADGVSGHNHVHSGVTTGSGDTGAPT